jgi:hypothetical protein
MFAVICSSLQTAGHAQQLLEHFLHEAS